MHNRPCSFLRPGNRGIGRGPAQSVGEGEVAAFHSQDGNVVNRSGFFVVVDGGDSKIAVVRNDRKVGDNAKAAE